MTARIRGARAAIVILALAAPAIARADAVPEPPSWCPPGTEPYSDHPEGSVCKKSPPKDCPRGWSGLLGGTCTLSTCARDSDCGKDKECVEHLTCLEPKEDAFYDYGELPDDRRSRRERLPREKSIIRYFAHNLCSAEVACVAPRTCLPQGICVPRGTRGLAYRGSNITRARVARTSSLEAALDALDAGALDAGATDMKPPQGYARPLEATAPFTGCASCTIGDPTVVSMGGLGFLALITLLWRRRR